jgi:DNA topoisomerase I
MLQTQITSVPRRKSLAVKTPSIVKGLNYGNCNEEGIIRRKAGKGFSYRFKSALVRDSVTLDRIRGLRIPPAWTAVWISADPQSHLQATGMDSRGRRQYIYHPMWRTQRTENKFTQLVEFGERLPQLRQQLEKDLRSRELDEQRVIALVISLMELTYMRIGNSYYEKENGTYGLTTLKDHHAVINNDRVRFMFRGKRGILHNVTIKNKKIAKVVKDCRALPGYVLFQYYNREGVLCRVDSGQVNRYIKACMGEQFSAKDFRTWAGTFKAFSEMMEAVEKSNSKTVQEILTTVSKHLGNTVAVCKKHYVHPSLLRMCNENIFASEVAKINISGKEMRGLSQTEARFLKFLRRL